MTINYTRRSRNLYIAPYINELWTEMEEQAKKEGVSYAYILLRAWAEQNGKKIPDYNKHHRIEYKNGE